MHDFAYWQVSEGTLRRPEEAGWWIYFFFYEAETMHAHSYTHVIHAWCFNDLLFLPSAGQRHQPSAVISGSSGPEPGPNTCIAHAPIAHSCMHACIPACIPPGSCVQYPRKRADPQSASEEKVGVCMHEPFLFFLHAYVVLAFSCLPFRPIQGVEKPKDLRQPEPSQPSRSSRPPEPKYPPRPSAKQAKRTPPAPPPKPPVLPKPWWPPPPPPAVKPIGGAKAPAAKSNPMDLGSVPKFIQPKALHDVHSCMHVALFFKMNNICIAGQAPNQAQPGQAHHSAQQIQNFMPA